MPGGMALASVFEGLGALGLGVLGGPLSPLFSGIRKEIATAKS